MSRVETGRALMRARLAQRNVRAPLTAEEIVNAVLSAHLALTRPMDPATLQQMQRDRDTLEVLRSAQKQLKQISLRYGE